MPSIHLAVRWVAQDDDGLGYDIEVSESGQSRRIESKARHRARCAYG
ncbi:MAG: DUF3883 domain-containing protein [Flavobacteriales bacterium]|nr:DUF3883 domain-containing protein [Flavobacteriales bacterium]